MRASVTLLGIAAAAVIAASAYILTERGEEQLQFETATVERGSVVKSVSASGVVNPVVTVLVGSQISGRIIELDADFNSEVKKDQVIARIDPEGFEAKKSQAAAELAVAKASVMTNRAAVTRAHADLDTAKATLAAAEADVTKAKVSAADLKLDLDRKRELKTRGAVAVSAVDKAKAAYETAVAQITSAEAQLQAQRSTLAARQAQLSMAGADVAQAEAVVEQRAAGLAAAETDLEHTYIRSPVDGVVIARSVDVGQTVAASLQAPTLFTIARDLRQMQVEASIDEADIGQIAPGQSVKFTVDSFPAEEFTGTVQQVRKAPLEVQNVVTYTVVISAKNERLRLLPGMTANVQILVSQRENVLRVADKALRFRPPGAPRQTAAQGTPAAGGGPPGAAQAAQRLQQLVDRLGLNEEQTEKVRALGSQIGQRLRSMRAGGATAADIREAAGQMRRQNATRMMAILTPEQQAKFRAMINEREANPVTRAELWVLKDGQPTPVPVFIGVGDGSYTEIVRGDIAEGDKVLVGVKSGGEQSASSHLFRFGF